MILLFCNTSKHIFNLNFIIYANIFQFDYKLIRFYIYSFIGFNCSLFICVSENKKSIESERTFQLRLLNMENLSIQMKIEILFKNFFSLTTNRFSCSTFAETISVCCVVPYALTIAFYSQAHIQIYI